MSLDAKPLVTVITVSYNSQKYIRDTIKSVLVQSYPNIEHIIVDGCSSDATISICSEYSHLSLYIGPDSGIYDAMNKGLSYANGDIIGFLNSDDYFVDQQAIQHIVDKFSDPKIQVVMSGICYVKESNVKTIARKWPAVPYTSSFYRLGQTPSHPGFYASRDCFHEYGNFNLDYTLAADFDLMFRFLCRHQVKSTTLSTDIVHMRLGGATNSSLRNIIVGNCQIFLSLYRHGFGLLNIVSFFFNKIFNKFSQFR